MRKPLGAAVLLVCILELAGCGGGGGGGGSPTFSGIPSVNASGNLHETADPQQSNQATPATVNALSRAPTVGPNGGFAQMVAFGDSLSDDGAYTLAAVSVYGAAPYNIPFVGLPYAAGGQFTVNGAPTGNWTNVLAQDLGLQLTPNLVGYGSPQGPVYLTPSGTTTDLSQAVCAFAIQGSCTDFAEGGAMVSNPDGIGHAEGALTIPITEQVANYLAQYGTFKANQLITILAGSNDVFTALANLSSRVQGVVADAAAQSAQAGNPVSQSEIAAIRQNAMRQALMVAQATVKVAANQLAAVVNHILAMGGDYVLVYTLPDSSLTPFGQSLAGGTTCDNKDPDQLCYVLSDLVQVFNQRLLNDLQGRPVKVVDGFALLNQEIANPTQFGFTNVTTPWCNLQLVPSSLLCNVATPNLAGGANLSDLNTWLFADTVHPTPAGYQVIAADTQHAIAEFGWIQ